MKKSLIALACGTLGFSVTEFGMMGILSAVSAGLNIAITKAGFLIAIYAVGICGGLAIAKYIAAKIVSIKKLLIILVGIMCCGNLLAMLSQSYSFMILARFISGLPHGIFLIAAADAVSKLTPKYRQVQSTLLIFYALTAAYLFGVPVATYLAQVISWRMMFIATAAWGGFVVYSLYRWMPEQYKINAEIFCIKLSIFKNNPAVRLAMIIILGNAGIFCWYTYINQIMVETAGFKFYAMAGIMMIAGLAMVLGKTSSEKLALKIKPIYLMAIMLGLMLFSSLLFMFIADCPYAALVLMFVGILGFSGSVLPEQKLGEDKAETVGITNSVMYLTILSFGNIIGAVIGAFPMAIGYAVEFSAFPAVIMLSAALVLLYYIYKSTQIMK
ncbi:MAG: MFS transporter [Alphaproteobacteria bacterium]|nr:MFS transporter [Alphaproteobacteria bacterium]